MLETKAVSGGDRTQTLAQWRAAHFKAWLDTRKPYVALYPNGEDTRGLFRLSDFAVSSVNGPWLCMVPRQAEGRAI